MSNTTPPPPGQDPYSQDPQARPGPVRAAARRPAAVPRAAAVRRPRTAAEEVPHRPGHRHRGHRPRAGRRRHRVRPARRWRRRHQQQQQQGQRRPRTSSTLSGEKLSGQGYTYELAEDWQDATDEAKGQDAPGTIDTVSIWGEKLDGSQANVIVEASSGVGDADLESLRPTWESNMSGASGSTPMDYDGTTIDGEEAIGAKFERDNTAGTAIVQIAYLTVHDGTAYSVILSTQQDKADDAMQAYDDLLGSWTWES